MTQKARLRWFTAPGLTDGARVAVQLDDVRAGGAPMRRSLAGQW
ncbi:hypothetical protein PP352_01745 [Mycobacteroides abscessus]|nr:hypothetical protein [Mycobacteroides abscessus]MDM2160858.1 hypothetical protein [Mycobacteroides abscessus]MDO3114030.1 hypothetical protein [Mycobacteroides abscessus subsp. massiliense]QST89211.1 hypothetical protein PROPHIGD44-1_24 [Mycobacterium phage prophiGD44-1]